MFSSPSGEATDCFLHTKPVYGLSVDPTNDQIFSTAGEDGRVLVFDLRKGTEVLSLAKYRASFHAVQFHPLDGSFVITANGKEGAAFWDLRQTAMCVFILINLPSILNLIGVMLLCGQAIGSLWWRRGGRPKLYERTLQCARQSGAGIASSFAAHFVQHLFANANLPILPSRLLQFVHNEKLLLCRRQR